MIRTLIPGARRSRFRRRNEELSGRLRRLARSVPTRACGAPHCQLLDGKPTRTTADADHEIVVAAAPGISATSMP
jgi:hypothetical protein